MILYSHVSLCIPCDPQSAETISALLGVQPTVVKEIQAQGQVEDGSWRDRTFHLWMLDSPKSHTDGNPTERLTALADQIEPFASRLPSLVPRFTPTIDVVYHVSPQDPRGLAGEFDWFLMPASLMSRLGGWDLSVSYESFWFNHPDWEAPVRTSAGG